MDKIKKIIGGKKASALLQFIKFGIVGASNTLISYGIEMLFYYVVFKNTRFSAITGFFSALGITVSYKIVRIITVTAIAFVVSVTNSYYWNNRYVFKTGNNSLSAHIKSYIKTFLCYGITGLVLSPVIKSLLTDYTAIPYYIASLASLIITIPLNFIMNKFWAFKKKV